MELNTIETSSHPDFRPGYIAPPVDREQDVRLVDVWSVIIRRKRVVLATLLSSCMLAAVYLLVTQPVYKAAAHLLPPQVKDIQGLLVDYSGLEYYDSKKYTPEFVYGTFLANLKSQGLRREFFDTHHLVEHYVSGKPDSDVNVERIFGAAFNQNLRVDFDKSNPVFVAVNFSDSEPEVAAQWLNQFIDFANKRTVEQLSSDVNTTVQAEISRIQSQLDVKLKLAEQRRHDNIAGLKEALRVARTLGIDQMNIFPAINGTARSELAVIAAELPLYLRGTRALESEITVLESRKSDEPFIKGYRDLQERRALLEGVSVDPDSLDAVTLDSVARVPYHAESPKKVQVLVLAALLGLVAGVLLAFIVDFLLKIRGEPAESPV